MATPPHIFLATEIRRRIEAAIAIAKIENNAEAELQLHQISTIAAKASVIAEDRIKLSLDVIQQLQAIEDSLKGKAKANEYSSAVDSDSFSFDDFEELGSEDPLLQRLSSTHFLQTCAPKFTQLNVVPKLFLYGEEIYPAIVELIDSTQSILIMKQFKLTQESSGWGQIQEALLRLNVRSKERLESGQPRIKFILIVTQMSAIARTVAKMNIDNKPAIDWIKANCQHIYFKDRAVEKLAFDTLHSKFTCADYSTLLISTMDPNGEGDDNKDEYRGVQLENACVVKSLESSVELKEIIGVHLKSICAVTSTELDAPSVLSSSTFADMKCIEAQCMLLGKEDRGAVHERVARKKNQFSPAKTAIIELLKFGESPIMIVTPNLNDKRLILSIIDATSQGKEIEIFLPKYRNAKREKHIGGDNVASVSIICKAMPNGKLPPNLKIMWLKNRLDQHSTDAQFYSKCSHAKFFAAGSWCLMGSTNLDKQSTGFCEEFDLLFEHKDLARSFAATLRKEFDERCFKIDNPCENIKADLINELDSLAKKINASGDRDRLLALIYLIDKASDVSELAFCITDKFKKLKFSDDCAIAAKTIIDQVAGVFIVMNNMQIDDLFPTAYAEELGPGDDINKYKAEDILLYIKNSESLTTRDKINICKAIEYRADCLIAKIFRNDPNYQNLSIIQELRKEMESIRKKPEESEGTTSMQDIRSDLHALLEREDDSDERDMVRRTSEEMPSSSDTPTPKR